MISVQRAPDPPHLVQNRAAWLVALGNATTDEQIRNAEGKYRHKKIKAALVAMFHGKCAYCESYLRHIDYGDVEHFRPKANVLYRHMIFDWANLLLACKVCNGPEYKGAKFPGLEEGGPPVDPALEDPNLHLRFVYDPIAKLATVSYKTERGRVTRDLFGLNRPELRAYRSSLLQKLYVLKELASTNPSAQDLLTAAKNDDAEFAAFARTL
ncbi:MAG: hypothetical protein WB439_03430 [Acidobacteriaceae bacterium]